MPRLSSRQNALVAVGRVYMVALGFRRQVIAINQDITPQGTPVVPGDSRVWSRKLSDGSTAYALVNLQDGNVTIPTNTLTSTTGETTAIGRVHDLWANLSYTAANFPTEVTVEPHGTMLYRVYPAQGASTTE